jgi:hypothetical protein
LVDRRILQIRTEELEQLLIAVIIGVATAPGRAT